jgi:hypothetical protein
MKIKPESDASVDPDVSRVFEELGLATDADRQRYDFTALTQDFAGPQVVARVVESRS